MSEKLIKATLPNKAEVKINGLDVILAENLHFHIKGVESIDDAAEACVAAGLDIDFSHFDQEKGVNVTYRKLDGLRIETAPEETSPQETPKPAKTTKKAA